MTVNEYADEDKKSLIKSGIDCISLPQISDRDANKVSAPAFKVYKKLTNSQSKNKIASRGNSIESSGHNGSIGQCSANQSG